MDATQLSFASKGIEDLAIQHQVDVNPLTGSAEISLPLPLTPGRSGFTPSLTLQYGSSAGNSVFGVGWSLAGLSSIGISSKDHLPKYDGKDKFAFNGEELVPVLTEQESGEWVPRIDELDGFRVHYYRLKVEQAYIRFEKWVHKDSGRIHWRTKDRNNVISVYGLDSSGVSRISDPYDESRTWAWLLEAQYDTNGNAIVYEYAPENSDNLDASKIFERDRVLNSSSFPQRYLKRICYGNTQPISAGTAEPDGNQWLFEVILDFGDHTNASHVPDQSWPVRIDPYSTFLPGFEVRTYRLCRRIMMFHRFAELGTQPSLVWIIAFDHHEDAAGTTLQSVQHTGFRTDLETGEISEQSLPPLTFNYALPQMGESFHSAPEQTKENFPNGLSDFRFRWVDLYGEGLPGILTETDQAWYFKSNCGNGIFGPQERVIEKPSQRLGSYALSDFDQDGNFNLVVLLGRQAGFCEYDRHTDQWNSFRPFLSAPNLDVAGANTQLLDINGNGRPDILVSRNDCYTLYPLEGKEGFGEPVEFAKPQTAGAKRPQAIAEDPELDLFFADMTGDGLLDQVRIQNGRVEYWPQIGHGRFGDVILMENAPIFDFDTEFDPGRLRLVDIDGSGTTDILYIGRGEVRYWINACGNSFVEEGRLTNLPYIDNLSTVSVLDFLGDGTPCLVWSSALPGNAGDPIHYLQLTSGVKPRLLLSIDNLMGRQDKLTYSSSGTHYLRDKNKGRKWISRLPSHATVVDKKEVTGQIGNSCFVSRYEYHDGYFDGEERIFRGFGMVEQYDSEFFENTQNIDEADYSAPVCIRSWYHNGMFGWDTRRAELYYSGDPYHAFLPTHTFEDLAILKPKEFDDGFRCLAGQMVRQEVFAISPEEMLSDHPYQVTQSTHTIRRLQPSTDKDDACFTFHMSETLTHEYDRQPEDPRITHQLVLDVDSYGNPRSACSIAYPRRSTISERAPAQQLYYISASCNEYINIDETDRYEVGIPFENREFELSDILPGETGILSLDQVKIGIDAALESPLDFNETFALVSSSPQARIIAWNRIYFWNHGITEPLPLGRVSTTTLVHHEESACFNSAMISDIFDSRIDPDSLSDFYYEFRDGYWWQPGPVLHYHSADSFFSLAREVSADEGETQYRYDEPYFLTLIEIHDALGNRTSAEIDYNVVAPFMITDPNNNISEVLYDPLGATMVSTFQGSILGPLDSPEIYGNDRLSEYTLQPDADFSAILAEPSRFLQNAGQFVFYELDSWSELEPGQPLRSISLVREEYVYDGAGGGAPDSRIQISVSYGDGFGRTLQSKQKVEPGFVIRRDDSGAVVLDSDGRPEEEHSDERWLVSGHTVYNNKQQSVRQYEPFFSSIPLFEPDLELRHYGVSDHLHYDSIGRTIRQDQPNGTFSRVETTPWEIRTYDPNDTVNDSEYRRGRETLPDGDQEKNALLKTLVHADTPTIVRLDPLGREIIQIETGRDGPSRITESRLDIQGNVTSITDPRDLAAFTYCYDMQGRLLFEHSIDAGDKWIFTDALDRPVHQWDSRGVHQQFEYDRLGRPVSVFANGAPGLNQVVERMAYDEDGSGLPAELKNSRGRLLTHYDQAGIQNIIKYSPEGNPLKTERQLYEKRLLEKYSSEPDWTDPDLSFEPDGVFTTETVYDALGRVTEQRPPDGTTRSTEYLPSGGITSIRVTTADGVLSDAAFLMEASYNARGQRTGAVLGNDVEISYVYDPLTFRMNRLTSVLPASAPGGPKTLQDIEYIYDPVGNIVHFVDHAQQPEPVHSDIMQGLHVSSHCEFTYDAFYQLTDATGRVHQALRQHDYRSDPLIENAIKGTRHLHLNNGAAVERYRRTYGYDLSGNIQYINHAGLGAGADSRSWNTEIWTSTSSNRSLPLNDLNGIPVTDPEMRFDANGNNIYMPHLRRIDWNYRNNISCAVIIDRSEEGLLDDAEHYVYGGDGMRVLKITENLTDREEGTVEITEKIYLDGCEIKRIHINDTLILERISSHISDGTNRIAILHQWNEDASSRETEDISEKKTHYQLSNHLGSSSLEINEHRDVISYEEYFPFGGTAFIVGDNVKEVKLKDYRYSGKERDDATGFYYYGYRYYAPWIGNWLSPDPIGPEDSLNLYQFVGNNPVNLVDPDGLRGIRGYSHVVEEYRQRHLLEEHYEPPTTSTAQSPNFRPVEELIQQVEITWGSEAEDQFRRLYAQGKLEPVATGDLGVTMVEGELHPITLEEFLRGEREGIYTTAFLRRETGEEPAGNAETQDEPSSLPHRHRESEAAEVEEGPESGHEDEPRNPSGAPADSNDTPEEGNPQVHSGDGSSRVVEPNNRNETATETTAPSLASAMSSLYSKMSSLASLPNRFAGQALRSGTSYISENVAEPILGETLGPSAVAWYQGQAEVVGELIQGLGEMTRRNAFGLPSFLNPMTYLRLSVEGALQGPERIQEARRRGEGSFSIWRSEMGRMGAQLFPQPPSIGDVWQSLPPVRLREEIGEADEARSRGDVVEASRRAGRASMRLVETALLLLGVRAGIRRMTAAETGGGSALSGGSGRGSSPPPPGSGGGPSSGNIRIVVGRGARTERTRIPDPHNLTTRTMANPSANPDFACLLRHAPEKFPLLQESISEILVERVGVGTGGMSRFGGLTQADVNAAAQLLRPGGRLHIVELPIRGVMTPQQLQHTLRTMLSTSDFRIISQGWYAEELAGQIHVFMSAVRTM